MAEQLAQQRLKHLARGCPGTARVVGLAEVALRPGVEQHVAGAAVEAVRGRAGLEAGQVGDAADVEDDPVLPVVTKQRGVKGGHQRRALAAGGDVATAKVANDADAGEFGEQRGIVELDGVALPGLVTDGLSVAADDADGIGRETVPGQESVNGGGIDARELLAEQGGLMEFIGAGLVQCQQRSAQFGRIG